MRLVDVTVDQMRSGANWRLLNPEERLRGGAPEALQIEPATVFGEDDHVVYSGVSVMGSGRATPLLMIKRVGEMTMVAIGTSSRVIGGERSAWSLTRTQSSERSL